MDGIRRKDGTRAWGTALQHPRTYPDLSSYSTYFSPTTQRADIHRLLLGLASEFMHLRLNSTVATIDPSAPSLTLTTGEVVKADLIIGADGVKSMIREVVLGEQAKPVATGDAAYRATIPTDQMLRDPDLRSFVEYPEMTGWMGPGRHVVGYNIVSQLCFPYWNTDPFESAILAWEPGVQSGVDTSGRRFR